MCCQELQRKLTVSLDENAHAEQKYHSIKTNYSQLLKQLKEADIDIVALEEALQSSDVEMCKVQAECYCKVKNFINTTKIIE